MRRAGALGGGAMRMEEKIYERKVGYLAILAALAILTFAALLQWMEPDMTPVPTAAEWEEMLPKSEQ